MSALQVGEPKVSSEDPLYLTHEFVQKIRIPSYLIALVAGNIQSKELGPRSRVWSEKAFLELAAKDFEDTEKMLATAESICGEYVWGRYDILVLPPSFPYGGMENPCLTFVTPTLLTGDKSLADVIAHEITHSWTGNLVTNKNFEHFWLNEGFTRFIERKIVGRLGGEARRQFSSHLGWSELIDCVQALGHSNPLTQLVVDLRGVDPEDAFSRVPYEKGSNFLYFLEQKVGGPEFFEPFLKVYIQEFAHKSIDTEVFKSYFINYFQSIGKGEEISDIDWNSWLFTPGMPVLKPAYDTSLLDPCIALKNRWDAWDPEKEPCPFSAEDLASLGPNQIVEFLNQLIISEEPFTPSKARALDSAYNLKNSVNTEIIFRWIRLACKAELEEELPLALDFVTKHGRMKFIQPIYRDLHKWEAARQQAIDTFNRNRPFMMHGSIFVTAKILGLRS
jgi:leukotriene-A4 hydrolase